MNPILIIFVAVCSGWGFLLGDDRGALWGFLLAATIVFLASVFPDGGDEE